MNFSIDRISNKAWILILLSVVFLVGAVYIYADLMPYGFDVWVNMRIIDNVNENGRILYTGGSTYTERAYSSFPILYLIGSASTILLGVDSMFIARTMPFMLYLVDATILLAISRNIFKDKRMFLILFIIFSGWTLVRLQYFVLETLGFTFFILLMYFCVKIVVENRQMLRNAFAVLAIITSILLIMTHYFTSFFAGLMLLGFAISCTFSNKRTWMAFAWVYSFFIIFLCVYWWVIPTELFRSLIFKSVIADRLHSSTEVSVIVMCGALLAIPFVYYFTAHRLIGGAVDTRLRKMYFALKGARIHVYSSFLIFASLLAGVYLFYPYETSVLWKFIFIIQFAIITWLIAFKFSIDRYTPLVRAFMISGFFALVSLFYFGTLGMLGEWDASVVGLSKEITTRHFLFINILLAIPLYFEITEMTKDDIKPENLKRMMKGKMKHALALSVGISFIVAGLAFPLVYNIYPSDVTYEEYTAGNWIVKHSSNDIPMIAEGRTSIIFVYNEKRFVMNASIFSDPDAKMKSIIMVSDIMIDRGALESYPDKIALVNITAYENSYNIVHLYDSGSVSLYEFIP